MFKAIAIALGLSPTGSQPAFAQELVVESQHSYFQAQMSTRDAACQREALNALVKQYDGIESLTITRANYWKSAVKDVENYAFPKSAVASSFGEVDAQITCLVYTQADVIIEISFQFEPGLKGAKRGLGADVGASAFASQDAIQITGAN